MSKRLNKKIIKKNKFHDDNISMLNLNLNNNNNILDIRQSFYFKRENLYSLSVEFDDKFKISYEKNNIFIDFTYQTNLDVIRDGYINEFNLLDENSNFENSCTISVSNFLENGSATKTLNLDESLNISNLNNLYNVRQSNKNFIFNDQLNDPKEIIKKIGNFNDSFENKSAFIDENIKINYKNYKTLNNNIIFSCGYTYKNSDYTNNTDSIIFGGKTY